VSDVGNVFVVNVFVVNAFQLVDDGIGMCVACVL
jgi:hypothetical protein